MMQCAFRSVLGAIGVLALAACAQHASSDKTSAGNAASLQPGVTLANPRAAEATAGSNPFPDPPAGYRGLGGALVQGNTVAVVTPDSKAPMAKHDLDVGLLHGIAARGYSESAPSTIRSTDCQGTGESPDSAIKVANLAAASDEVTAGIACARLLHPGTHWLMSQLVTKGDGYISQVALRDTGGNVVLVYTDINRQADELIGDLGG
ncbi:MAG TPA: hypothetical protein VHE77_18685 [Dongiaceae bacterium]|nr:hypothetical protein [Dongiaceae bacterium]